MNWKDAIWRFRDSREYLEKVRKGFPPLVITVAITGGIHGAEANPNLPETPEAQAEETYKAYEAGATVVHAHARDPRKGYATNTTRTEDFYKMNKLIRERCPDIIINNTTGAGAGFTVEERLCSLDAGPELASLDVGAVPLHVKIKKRLAPLSGRDADQEIDTFILLNYAQTELYATEMKKRGIKPELELFYPSQYWYVDNLIQKKLVDPPYLIQFVMGFAGGGIYATPWNLLQMLDELSSDALFQVIGIGPDQVPMTTMAIMLGGNVRVGFEDNVYYRKGEKSTGNAQMVERVVRIAHELGREVATPAQAREIFNVDKTPSQYP